MWTPKQCMQSKLGMPKRGDKESLNIRIITEELMEFHDVTEFEGNVAAYNSFY